MDNTEFLYGEHFSTDMKQFDVEIPNLAQANLAQVFLRRVCVKERLVTCKSFYQRSLLLKSKLYFNCWNAAYAGLKLAEK